jgi:hypothetical protein
MDANPIEITKEEYHKAVVAAWNKARKLSGKTTGEDCDPACFHSRLDSPRGIERVLRGHSWENYRMRLKKGVDRITHSLDKSCSLANQKTKTDCLAKVGSRKDGFKYYQCTHLIGQCPWKE